MATKDSREVVIEATPEQILDVIADVEATPTWSPQYQKAEVLDRYDNGRPKQVRMTVKAAGLTDEQVIEYTWARRLRHVDAGLGRTSSSPRTPVTRSPPRATRHG